MSKMGGKKRKESAAFDNQQIVQNKTEGGGIVAQVYCILKIPHAGMGYTRTQYWNKGQEHSERRRRLED
jgi:hypothetical protein